MGQKKNNSLCREREESGRFGVRFTPTARERVFAVYLREAVHNRTGAVQGRRDLKLLAIQRRSLAKHPSFRIAMGKRTSRLKPDALFLYRQEERGMMVCCVEMDTGSMNQKQVKAKFSRCQAWAKSETGKEYLLNLYHRHGATDPRPVFRLLVVVKNRSDDDERRLEEVLAAAGCFPLVLDRLWIASVADLRKHEHDSLPLGAAMWRRGRDVWSNRSKASKEVANNKSPETLASYPVFPARASGNNSASAASQSCQSSPNGWPLETQFS